MFSSSSAQGSSLAVSLDHVASMTGSDHFSSNDKAGKDWLQLSVAHSDIEHPLALR
jgi:hypothetical protein